MQTRWLVAGLVTALVAGTARAQDPAGKPDEKALEAQVAAIRQKVRDAVEAARKAREAESQARVEAAEALASLPAGAIPILERLTDDPDDPQFNESVHAALVRLGWVSPDMRERMAAALEKIRRQEWNPFEDAVTVIELGTHAATELAKALPAETKSEVRETMVSLLGDLANAGFAEGVPALGALLTDKSWQIRGRALAALARAGEVPAGEDPTDEAVVRRREALVRVVEERKIVPAVVSLLKHDEAFGVRRQAARALGNLKRRDAVQALVGACADAKPEVGKAAGEALESISGAGGKPDAKAWQAWWTEAAGTYPPQVLPPAVAPGK